MTYEKQYVSEKIVSEITGMSCSTLQKHRFFRQGIPYIKVGKSVRYCLGDVYSYLEARRVTYHK